jgi:hypothetical protein
MSVDSLGCLNVLVTSPVDFPVHLCNAEFDNVIEIDRNRQVLFYYSA